MELSPQLRHAVGRLRIADDRRTVLVGERPVTGDSPRALRPALGAALYDEWHAGIARDDRPNRLPRRDRAFEDRLTAATPHALTPVDAVLRSGPQAVDGVLLAELGRVLVGVPADSVRTDGPIGPGRPAVVDLPAVRPALSPGFLLLDGPHGGPPAGDGRTVLRMYVHLTDPGAAPGVWRALLTELASRSALYRAKVLSRPWSYPRRDALVVYLAARDAPLVTALAAALTGLPGIGTRTSVFAREVAPGIALAWEPTDRRAGWTGKSFGQHRAAAVAEGFLRYAHDPDAMTGFLRHPSDASSAAAAQEIHRSLNDAAADPSDPSRNLDSPPAPAPKAPGTGPTPTPTLTPTAMAPGVG